MKDIGHIEIQRVCLGYKSGLDTKTVIQDLSLTLDAGSFTSFIGASGCGKSTLLNAIGGHYKPLSGSIILDGVEITTPGADLGIVFQQHTLFPWKTVKENVRFGPMRRGVGRAAADKLADEYIELVGLSGYENYYPKMLSGGMQHRAEIARALANKPAVLLMDEPFGALDAQMRASLQDSLLSIWENTHVTIVFVTHDVNEAIRLSQRVVIISRRSGSISSIIETNRDHDEPIEQYMQSKHTQELKKRCLEMLSA
ncbi:MAG: ABC transporter ATP-binding protein [Acidithiobacillus sp.]